jgi:signal peptidase I
MFTPADEQPSEIEPPAEEPTLADVATPTRLEQPAESDRADEPTRKEGAPRSFLHEVPILVLIALVLAILVKTFLVQAFFIPSESMEPTLMTGDRVLVNKVVYRIGDIHRFDIIVFANPHPALEPDRGPIGAFVHWLGEGIGLARPPDEDYIKRVIGLPGETVEIRDHSVYVDGKALDEPYLTSDARAAMVDYGPVSVPANSLFVLGDNRGHSGDSRFGLGFIPEDKVIGRAFVIIWPPSDLGLLH